MHSGTSRWRPYDGRPPTRYRSLTGPSARTADIVSRTTQCTQDPRKPATAPPIVPSGASTCACWCYLRCAGSLVNRKRTPAWPPQLFVHFQNQAVKLERWRPPCRSPPLSTQVQCHGTQHTWPRRGVSRRSSRRGRAPCFDFILSFTFTDWLASPLGALIMAPCGGG